MRQLSRFIGQLLRLDYSLAGPALDEARVSKQCPVEAEQGGDAADRVLVEGPQHPPPGVLTVDAVDDELRDQGVVEADNFASGCDAGIDPHTRSRRLPVARDPPGRGQEAGRRIFGVDAALDRVAAKLDVVLAQR